MTTPCPCISYFCIPLSIFVSTPSLSLFFCLSLSYIAIFLYFCNYITFILSICLSLSLFFLYPTGHSIFLWCLGSFQILYIFQPIGPTQHPLLSWLLTYRLYIYKDSTTFQKSLHPTGQFQILNIFQPIGRTQHPLLSWLMTYRLYSIHIQRQHNISKITPPYWAVFRFFIFSNPLDEHSILFSWLLTYRHHRQQNIWLFKYIIYVYV